MKALQQSDALQFLVKEATSELVDAELQVQHLRRLVEDIQRRGRDYAIELDKVQAELLEAERVRDKKAERHKRLSRHRQHQRLTG